MGLRYKIYVGSGSLPENLRPSLSSHWRNVIQTSKILFADKEDFGYGQGPHAIVFDDGDEDTGNEARMLVEGKVRF